LNAISPAGAASPRVDRLSRGIGFMLVMAAFFSLSDALVKHLGPSYPVLVLLWARYALQFLSMGLWKLWLRRRYRVVGTFRTGHAHFQLLRALLLLANTGIGFTSLRYLPLAEFTALVMLAPIASTILARLVLKERVTWQRWCMVALGFVGVLLVVRPGAGLLGWPALMPLSMAGLFASFQILTSRMSSSEDPLTTHFYTGAFSTLILSVLLWAVPWDVSSVVLASDWGQWGMLVLIGFLGSFGHLFLILAVGMAPLSLLMPLTYSQIGFALLIGWLVFRQVPDGFSLAGMVVIAISGAVTVWLSTREAPKRHQPDSALAFDTHL
jgi:drug/metabolite transporter (DMT)-like permease